MRNKESDRTATMNSPNINKPYINKPSISDIEKETETYLFEVTGGFEVRKDLKPEKSAYGDVIKFRLPDGRAAQLIVALEIEIDDGIGYEYIVDSREMTKLGLECLDYDHLHFIKTNKEN